MKRALIISLIVLFCAAAFGFNYFGKDIRDALAPRVETGKIKYSVYGPILPSEAVRADESGQTYVMFAVKTDKYPERGYEALRMDCELLDMDFEIMGTDDSDAQGELMSFYKSMGIDYLPIVSSDKEVLDGRRVIVAH